MRWHVYCRVVDNFGDIGFAWRLGADLADRGEHVRLATDDPAALARMAPDQADVEIAGWDDVARAPADVVVELFGGGIPAHATAASAAGAPAPLQIDVEHLSAEPFAVRSHGLPSPRPGGDDGPRRTTWYYYPGFDARTGGLVREQGLLERRAAFDAERWLATIGIATRPGERRVGVFCYPNDALAELLDELVQVPTLLLLTQGFALEQARALLGTTLRRGRLRGHALPFLSQVDFDRLLWSCDLNLVRGEDSLVRAVWSGAPFLWQLYPQGDGAHRAKLEAFLDRFLDGTAPPLDAAVRTLFRRWNGSVAGSVGPGISFGRTLGAALDADWRGHCRRWRDTLAAQDDLVTRLLAFAVSKR